MMRSKHFGKVLNLTLLMLLGCGLCRPSLHAEIPVTPSAPVVLQELSFSSDATQTKIAIRANQAFDYTSYYPNPRLFILDIPGAQPHLDKNFVDFKTTQVDFASVSQIGEGPRPMVRIEFNLVSAVHYSLKPEGNSLLLTFKAMNPSLAEAERRMAEPRPLAPKQAEMAPKATFQPRDVALREDDQQIELILPTASRPSFKHFELASPSRLVIDIDDSIYRVSKQFVKLESDIIRRIRFGYGDSQQGKLVRCVFDLSRQTAYTVEAADAGVVIRFQKPGMTASTKPAALESPEVAQSTPLVEFPQDPSPITVSNLAMDSQVLNGLLTSEARTFAMPVPLAAPRNLSLLEGKVSLAQIDPRDKQASTQLLADDPKIVKPLPPPEPSPVTEVARLQAASPESVEDSSATAVKVEPQLLSPEPVAPVQPELPATATVASSPAAPEQVAAAPQNPVSATSAVTSSPAELAAPVDPAPLTAPPTAVVRSVPAHETTSQVISAVPVVQAPKYTGELISLELKDADIKDFFRLIGEISGLNIVLDPDVKGSLTIFLNDVPWDQALDVVLRNNSLGKQLDGNVLRIASNPTLESEEAQRKRLSDARVLAAELQTETRILSYAKAAELSTVLKKVLSARGDIIVDTRTNALIISDIPGRFAAIDALIKQLDKKIKQVEIEARVIAATRDFLRDVGVQLGAIYGNYQKNTVAGAVPGNPFSRTPPPSVTIPPGQSGGAQNAMPLLWNLGANAPTSGISFLAGITDRFLLDAVITAAERRGSAKLLSKPRIITQDNIEGFVQQGVKIPVQTTINNTVSVQFFDFSLKLTVTPQITDEGTIILKVDVENSTPDFSRQVQGVPTVNTQQTKTTVLALNGGTVVIGGVMIDSEQVNVRQVPGFGTLPVIGNLFKNRSVTKQTQELIFFLSPKIL
jgi:type IV pilus secretin PilQ/predicted competence protein